MSASAAASAIAKIDHIADRDRATFDGTWRVSNLKRGIPVTRLIGPVRLGARSVEGCLAQ
jgi:hypothetical protein